MNDYVYFKVIPGTRDWMSPAYSYPVSLSPHAVYKVKEHLWNYMTKLSPARRGEFKMLSQLDLLLETKGDLDAVQELI
jgi:hypothetical protein